MSKTQSFVHYRGRIASGAAILIFLAVGFGGCGGGGGASAVAPIVQSVHSSPGVSPSPGSSPTPHVSPTPRVSPTPNVSPTPPPSPTPTPIAMTHVLTWEDLGGDGVILNPWSLASPWLNYAKTPFMYATAIQAVGIIPVPYTDPNRQQTNGPMYNNDESTFAHDCNGNRITQVGGANNGAFLMDPHSAHLAQIWHDYVAAEQAAGASFVSVMEDNADEVGKLSGMPCNFNQADWTNATNAMDQVLGYQIVYNSLSHTGSNQGQPVVAPSIALNATSIGGMSEDCYVEANGSERVTVSWLATELTEIDMATAAKLFVCNGTMTNDAAASAGARIYQLASFLLTYDPQTSIMESTFRTPSNFHVFPEMQLVALKPLVPEPTSPTALLQSGGAYGREYAACFFAGKYVGPCAAVVNSDKAPAPAVPFPWPSKYHHTLTVSGYGVLDGGTASTSGGAPPASIADGAAVIAFP